MRARLLTILLSLLTYGCGETPAEPTLPVDEEDGVPLTSAAASASSLCTKNWQSGVGGSWLDASRWTPKGVPTSTDHVCIDAIGTYDVLLQVPVTVREIRIGGPGATVNFEFDAPAGSEIALEDGMTIGAGSTLRIPSRGQATISADQSWGRLWNYGTIRIFNSCACGGDVAVLDFADIHNNSGGRMELEAPMTVSASKWTTGSATVILTSGSGVIDLVDPFPDAIAGDGSEFHVSGTANVVGSTQVEVPRLTWNDGVIGTIGSGESVVNVGRLLYVSDTGVYRAGRVDGGNSSQPMSVWLGSVGAGTEIHLETGIMGITVNPFVGGQSAVNDGVVEIVATDQFGRLRLTDATFVNRGSFRVAGGGTLTVVDGAGASLSNEGQLELVSTDLKFETSGQSITNLGLVQGTGSASLAMGAGTEFVSAPGSTVSAPLTLEGGTLRGTGTLADVVSIGGTIELDSPNGTLNTDDVLLDGASELVVTVAKKPVLMSGRLVSTGDVAFDGKIRAISPANAGACGDVVTPVIYAGSGTGSLTMPLRRLPSTNHAWRVQHTSDSVVLAGYVPDKAPIGVSQRVVSLAEGGAPRTVHVCLGTSPGGADVLVSASSSGGQLLATPTLQFPGALWALPQALPVQAFDDAIVEPLHGDNLNLSASSSNSAFVLPRAIQIGATITDDDGDADLEIALEDAVPPVAVGATVQVVYRITNHGPTLSTGSTITVDPQGSSSLAFASAIRATCTEGGAGVLTCAFAGLAAGASEEVVIAYSADATGTTDLVATIAGQQPDGVGTNNSVAVAVVVN